MYLGKIVEYAYGEDLYKNPRHPYTKALIAAIPVPDVDKVKEKHILLGDVPSPINPPSGCYFHPRCPFAQEKCKVEAPVSRNLGTAQKPHIVACHYA